MIYRAIIPAVLAFGVLMGAAVEEMTAKDVMKAANKGKDSLWAKVTSGKGNEEDAKKLADFYEALTKAKAPQGDAKSWETKTSALAAAAKNFAEKKPGALEKLKAAGECKACHSVHKPK